MKRFGKGALAGCVGVLLLARLLCAETIPDALFQEASSLLHSAQKIEQESFSEAYRYYKTAYEKIESLLSKHPTSLIARQLSNGDKKVGPYSLTIFKDKILPNAKRKADAEANPIHTALLIAETKADPAYRDSVLWSVVTYYSKYEQDNRILEVAALGRGSQKVELLMRAADAYHKIGKNKKATHILQTARQWTYELKIEDQARILAMISQRFIQLGEIGQAKVLLKEALEKSELMKPTDRPYIYIAIGYAKAGEKETALGLFEKEISLHQKIEWGLIAEHYAEAGLFDHAWEAIKRADGLIDRPKTLSEIAVKMARGGQQARALELLSSAVRIATQSQSAVEIEEKVNNLLYLYNSSQAIIMDEPVNQDLVERADTLIEGVQDPYIKVKLLSKSAVSYFIAGDQEKAMRLLSESLKIVEKHPSISKESIIMGYVGIGKLDQALSMARTLRPDHARTVLENIASRFADKGSTDLVDALLTEALQLEDSSEESIAGDLKRNVRYSIIHLYLRSGNQTKAIHLLDQQMDDLMKPGRLAGRWEYINLAELYVKAGNKSKATSLLKRALESRSIARGKEEIVQETALIASAFAETGEYSEALKLVNDIPFNGERVRVLVYISGSMAKAGERTKAIALLSEALQIISKESHPPTWILSGLGKQFLKVDRIEDAIRVTEMMAEGWQKTDLLIEISEKYLVEGNKANAISVLKRIRTAGTSELVEQAKLWAKLGKPEEARRLLIQARDGVDKDSLYSASRAKETLAWIAADYVEARFYDQGMKIAQSITETFLEGAISHMQGGLWQVVENLTEAGEYEKAAMLLSNAVRLSTKINSKNSLKAPLLDRIGHAYIQIGEKERGLEILSEAFVEAEKVPNGDVFVSIGSSFMSAGEKEKGFQVFFRAVELLRNTSPEWAKAIELGSIALSTGLNINEVDTRLTRLLHEIIESMEL